MRKSFDELTIVDDFMFCSVMRRKELCKELLSLVLPESIGPVTEIIYQKTLDENYNAKSIRLDILAGDTTGRLYNIEMQVANQYNLAKRLRYYQSALDISHLNKGQDYNDLPETWIIFFCTFDYIQKDLPLYTFNTICTQDVSITLPDGITKVIINSKAADKEKNSHLQAFLHYMNGTPVNDKFVQKLEKEIGKIKQNDTWRETYMMLSTLEMDARREGIQQGISQGIQQGVTQGKELGANQKARETASELKKMGLEMSKIARATGLSEEEIRNL